MRLNDKGRLIVKLSLWAGILTWCVFFLILGVTMTVRLHKYGQGAFGEGGWAVFLYWLTQVFIIVMAIAVVLATMRLTYRRLRRKPQIVKVEGEAKVEVPADSIELDDSDLRAVASNRFWKAYRSQMGWVVVVCFVAIAVVARVVNQHYVYLTFIPLVPAIGYLLYLNRKRKKFEDNFLNVIDREASKDS